MKRLLWLLLVTLAFAQGYNAYQTSTFTTTGSATRVFENSTILFHQLSWTKTGTVSSCTIAVDSSPDNITWTAGGIITGQTCTSNGSSAVTSGSTVYIRVTVTAFGGGGSLAVVYKGWTQNPSGGGPPTGAAGGDLSGTYPNPSVATSTTQAVGDNTTKVATTAFVQNVAAGINPAVAVQAASAAVLPNSPTYSNGVAGIGATLTTATTNTPLVVDGYTPILADRILVKNQASAFQNGVYTVTQVSGVALAWILTRALDYDQPSDMNNTGAIPVLNGTANAITQWVQSSKVNTVGTDAVTFTQFGVAVANLTTPGVGGFYGSWGLALPQGTSGGQVSTANTPYCVQFVLPISITVNKASIQISTSAASSTYTAGIYDISKNKLVDSGSFNTATTGAKTNTLASPVALAPGVYWFCESQSDITMKIEAGVTTANLDAAANNNSQTIVSAGNSTVSGVLPVTLGTLTTQSGAHAAGVVYFQP